LAVNRIAGSRPAAGVAGRLVVGRPGIFWDKYLGVYYLLLRLLIGNLKDVRSAFDERGLLVAELVAEHTVVAELEADTVGLVVEAVDRPRMS
jgi:hypothetical protein